MRTALTIFILALLLGKAVAQSTGTNTVVAAAFERYRANAYTEKTFAQTDKEDYLAGEIIWWKLYCVDGIVHQPSLLSKLGYVELIDAQGKPALQAKAALDKGFGEGSFFLPVTLPSGDYELRAYTQWMKNDGAAYFFRKSVRIINPFRNAAAVLTPAAEPFDIQFFPEGGKLIEGLPSRVAFQVKGKQDPAKANITIVNGNGDTITHSSVLHDWIGSFNLTPAAQQQYKAIVTMPGGQQLTKTLPAPVPKGYAITVKDDGKGPITVSIQTNTAGSSVLLFAQTRQDIRFTRRQPINNGTATIIIGREEIGEGITQLTLFNEASEAVAERLLFKFPSKELHINIDSALPSYGTRERIHFNINSTVKGVGSAVNCSVSVTLLDSLYIPAASNSSAQFWLNADLQTPVKDPNWYFEQPIGQSFPAIDNLMLTQRWKRFDWPNILATATRPTYTAELDGHIISARVLDETSGQPVSNIPVLLSVTGGKPQFYSTTSDANGWCYFDVHDYYGNGSLVLQVDKAVSSGYRFQVASPFFEEKKSNLAAASYPLQVSLEKDLTAASFAMQVRNTYSQDEISRFKAPLIDSLPFYGNQASVYPLDKYTRFTSMEEVLREYILEIAVRQREGKPQLLILDPTAKGFFFSEPLILLDGIPVSSSTILAVDPLLVQRIEVMGTRYLVGDYLYDGVASFITYQANAASIKYDRNAVSIEYDGLQLQREFYSPHYAPETEALKRKPDYRTTLYWEPQLKTSKEGKKAVEFFSGDIPGKYKVVVEGMNEQGQTGYHSFFIEIVEKK